MSVSPFPEAKYVFELGSPLLKEVDGWYDLTVPVEKYHWLLTRAAFNGPCNFLSPAARALVRAGLPPGSSPEAGHPCNPGHTAPCNPPRRLVLRYTGTSDEIRSRVAELWSSCIRHEQYGPEIPDFNRLQGREVCYECRHVLRDDHVAEDWCVVRYHYHKEGIRDLVAKDLRKEFRYRWPERADRRRIVNAYPCPECRRRWLRLLCR